MNLHSNFRLLLKTWNKFFPLILYKEQNKRLHKELVTHIMNSVTILRIKHVRGKAAYYFCCSQRANSSGCLTITPFSEKEMTPLLCNPSRYTLACLYCF